MRRRAVITLVVAASALTILGAALLAPRRTGTTEMERGGTPGVAPAAFDRELAFVSPLDVDRAHDALASSLAKIAGNLAAPEDVAVLAELSHMFLTDDRTRIESVRKQRGLAAIYECWPSSQQREYEQRLRRSFRSRAALDPTPPSPYSAMSEQEWVDAIERMPLHELLLARDPTQPPPAQIDAGSIRWTYTPTSGRPDLINDVLSRHRAAVETLSRAVGGVEPVAAEGPSFWTLCVDGGLDSPLYQYGPFVDCIVEARFTEHRFGVAQFVFVRHPTAGWIPAYSRTATWARQGAPGAHWLPRF